MKDKRVMNHKGHVIWMNDYGFMVALDRNGTDRYFATFEDAIKAIDQYNEKRKDLKKNV